MRKSQKDGIVHSVPCWYCEHRVSSRQITRDGILRSRRERDGGPYRLHVCPACGRENVCERTTRNRWFASPNYRFTFLDYLFSQVLDPAGAETILAALTWFRENEERRRYFFESDGDSRYSGRSFLSRFWPVSRQNNDTASKDAASKDAASKSTRPKPRPSGPAQEPPAPPRPRSHRLVTPHEVLGLLPDASDREIRAAFQRLAIIYHPDKVHHLGEDFERVARQKFQELKEAYEVLQAVRGRKPG